MDGQMSRTTTIGSFFEKEISTNNVLNIRTKNYQQLRAFDFGSYSNPNLQLPGQIYNPQKHKINLNLKQHFILHHK